MDFKEITFSQSSRYLQDNTTNGTQSNISISFPSSNVTVVISDIVNIASKLVINTTTTTGHIANFKQFFKISAFFIAFILFYAISVPLIMWLVNKDFKVIGGLVQGLRNKAYSNGSIKVLSILWILYVLVLPFTLLIVWGMLLAWDPVFSNQFGIGISLIGIFVLFVFLGFADWYGHGWQLTKLSIGLFISATISAFFYCFAVIFLPKYFTYNGTTAIFMSLSFIFSTLLIYLKTTSTTGERFLKLDILVQSIVDTSGGLDEGSSTNDKLKEVMEQVNQKNKRYLMFTKIALVVLYLLTFGAYIAVIVIKNPKQYKLVGVAHCVVLILSDLMIFCLDNKSTSGVENFLVQDWFKCLYQFVTRLVCCFLLDYWLAMQSIALILSIVIVGSNFLNKFFSKEEVDQEGKKGNKFSQLVLNEPLFRKYVEKNITEVVIQTEQEVILLIYVGVFIGLSILTANLQSYLQTKNLVLTNTFPQWVIPLFALMLGVLCALFYGWFRYYKNKCNYVPGVVLFVSLAIIEGISIAMGGVFYSQLSVKVHLIWTSFAVIPIIIGCFLLFLGNWTSNDYFFYDPQGANPPREGEVNQIQPIDENNDKINEVTPLEMENPEPQVQNNQGSQPTDQDFCSNFVKLLSCGYLPLGKTFKDKLTFSVVVVNVALLLLYTILTAAIFKPWWIGFTIGMWLAIIQLTIIIFIKYYQMYYKMSFAVQFCLILAVSLFLAWVVVIAIYVFSVLKEKTLPLVIFSVVSGGYIFLVILLLAFLKLVTLTDKTQLPLSLQLLFAFASLLIGGIGGAIIGLTTGQVWGHVLCGTSVFLILMIFLQQWRKWVSLLFGVILLGYAIFGIIYYHSNPTVVLQCLSMILIVIFLFFAVNFIRVYLQNKEARATSIFMYSDTLFPVMRYDYAENKMVASNTELIFFFLAALTFFIWSFLAGILLKLEDRYIGISFSAITISFVYLYVSDRLKKALFLLADEFSIANLHFYTSSINHALQLKKKWRATNGLSEQGITLGAGNEVDLAQDEVQKELSLHNQWQDLFQMQSGELQDTFGRLLFFSTTTKEPSVLSSQDERVLQQQQSMKDSDTPEKRMDVLLKTQDIMHHEKLFTLQFFAFLNGYLNLKLRNLNDKLKQAMELWALGQITEENTDDQYLIEQERKRKEQEQKQADEARKRQEAFLLAEEQRRKEQENQNNQNNNNGEGPSPQQPQNVTKSDEVLVREGDRMRQQVGNQQFIDRDFDQNKALDDVGINSIVGWNRVQELTNEKGQPFKTNEIKVFHEGQAANDIRQGELGDCYLLSAFSIVAHTRSDLLVRLFHPQSMQYNPNGLYTVMFFKNRKPVVIHVDDYFPTDQHKRYPFVKCFGSNQGDVKEIWPIILEKAYAKMYGCFKYIVGGHIDEALSDLTNGAPMSMQFKEADVKKMFNSGELWQRLTTWNNQGYLMGCSSPAGSDSDTSNLGIVQGHAYSILDICEVDGNKLLQVRNPWGEDTEWKGAWSDQSSDWNERRRQIIQERARQRGVESIQIGKVDGTFWINYVDWFTNFSSISMVRCFDEQTYTEINYTSEWSIDKGTAGGCVNHDSFPQNPQLKLYVEGNQPVEVFVLLASAFKAGDNGDCGTIGFRIVENHGVKIDRRNYDQEIAINYRGYMKATRCSLDTKLQPTSQHPYILIATTFEPGEEMGFTLTLWYNHTQGRVILQEF